MHCIHLTYRPSELSTLDSVGHFPVSTGCLGGGAVLTPRLTGPGEGGTASFQPGHGSKHHGRSTGSTCHMEKNPGRAGLFLEHPAHGNPPPKCLGPRTHRKTQSTREPLGMTANRSGHDSSAQHCSSVALETWHPAPNRSRAPHLPGEGTGQHPAALPPANPLSPGLPPAPGDGRVRQRASVSPWASSRQAPFKDPEGNFPATGCTHAQSLAAST